jgi:hypothetical protein
MKIYAPVKDANGIWATVRFVNGVGETDNPRLIEWFKSHGYKVPLEEPTETQIQRVEEAATVLVEDVGNANQPDFEAMSVEELRAWAKEHGLGGVVRNTKNKEKLLEIIRG